MAKGLKRTIIAVVFVSLCFVLTVSAFFWLSPEPQGLNSQSWIKPRHCNLGIDLVGLLSAECVLVNVASTNSESPIFISLAVIRRNSGSEQSAIDQTPLVYLPGGPGIPNTTGAQMLNYWAKWYYGSSLKRPLVLLDYRGLAPSEPAPSCPDYKKAGISNLSNNLNVQEETQILTPLFESCLASIDQQANGHGLPNFVASLNSEQLAQDIRIALKRLGFAQWHLLGVSFGSRIALLSALAQPEVNKVILDSPYVLSLGKPSDLPVLWARAIEGFFQRCKLSSRCSKKTDLEQFWSSVRKLKVKPLQIFSENWVSKIREPWVLNDVRLAGMLFSMMYAGQADERIASLLLAIADEDTQSSQAEFDLFYNLLIDRQFQEWFYMVLTCNDQAQETMQAYQARIGKLDPAWQDMFALAADEANCKHPLLSKRDLPVMQTINKPVLVAVGQLDPITPAAEAAELKEFIKQGIYLNLPRAGHAMFSASECGKEAIGRFLNTTAYQEIEREGLSCFRSQAAFTPEP